MKKLLMKLKVYDDGTLIFETKGRKTEGKTNPEALTSALLLLALGSLGRGS